MTVFPKGKHDDQVDSTAQFLDWVKRPMSNWSIFELYRQQAEELETHKGFGSPSNSEYPIVYPPYLWPGLYR
jgi:hypothetical protein